MNCPFCQHETKVIDSRFIVQVNQIKRRRECLRCQERFTTFERAEMAMPKVVKRDGRRVPFDEGRLRTGLTRALQKRPVSVEDFEALVADISGDILKVGEREIESSLIGQIIMQHLRQVDPIAYVRFASVYQSFEDVEAFKKLISALDD